MPLTEKEVEFLKKSLKQNLESFKGSNFPSTSEYTALENILKKLPNTELVSSKEIDSRETILEH